MKLKRLIPVDIPEKPVIHHTDWTGNYHSVVGCLGASNEHNGEREENDYYATPPEATEWLLKLEELNHNIWEPACGEGHISKVLEAAGHSVFSSDLIDRGYGKTMDFLTSHIHFAGDIVTNPPYKIATPFVYHALESVGDYDMVCMFLKVQFLESQERRKLFDEYPPIRVWVTSNRLSCGKNGNFQKGMIAYAWFVWQKGYHGDTTLKWFN